MTGILLHKHWVGQKAKNNFWVGQAFLAYYCSHRPGFTHCRYFQPRVLKVPVVRKSPTIPLIRVNFKKKTDFTITIFDILQCKPQRLLSFDISFHYYNYIWPLFWHCIGYICITTWLDSHLWLYYMMEKWLYQMVSKLSTCWCH